MEDVVPAACPEEVGQSLQPLLELALRLCPHSGRAWTQQGRALWLAGRCDEAAGAWQTAVAVSPLDTAAWLLYLQPHPQLEPRPDPAIAGAVAEYAVFRGDRCLAVEEWEHSLEWYELAFSLAPARTTAADLENVYLHLGLGQEAISRWEELVTALPESDPEHWWAVGRSAELKEYWVEAAQAYGQGVLVAEETYSYLMRQGDAYRQLQDYEAAEAAYWQAAEARPDLPWPYLSLGNTLRAREDYHGALNCYSQAELLGPAREEPKYSIGRAHCLLEDYALAQLYLRQALLIEPQHAGSAYWLAKCLRWMGEWDDAVDWLRSAIEWHEGQHWTWVEELGDWLAQAGDSEGALSAYRQALDWHPGDEDLQEKIRWLEEP
jgi:tetratricopeptide (TPR) repeat protein